MGHCLRFFYLLWLGLVIPLYALAAPAFEDSMAQRALACTACHGAQGRAGPDGYYPRLAGKPAGYLYRQLRNFREGRRHYAPMTSLLDTLDDAYLQELASYFSALSLPYPAPRPSASSAQELEQARRLVQQGDAARGLPACTQCHGLLLTGVNPATPGLLGLPADYLNAQLGGWQTGQRHADAPDCMAHIARLLSANETSAIARWLSAQALPPNTQAAARRPTATAAALALQCGSDLPLTAAGAVPFVASTTLSDPATRGAYLARMGNCAGCHSARGGMAYAGGRAVDTPFGSIFSSNLTPDPLHGIGLWSADDFWQALHQGISKDGHALYPAFPYTSYTRIGRADSDALFAFLKTLPAASVAPTAHRLRWPYNTQLALKTWRTLFFTPSATQSTGATAGPAADPVLQRGAYLVQGLGHCMECHGSRNALGALSGDASGALLPGSLWWAPSLSDPGGAAGWSEAELAAFLQTGRNDRAQASGPMAEVVLHSTQYLSDADALAMARYLRAMAQRAPSTLATPSPSAAAGASRKPQQGARLYEKHCADCHGAQGQGRAGVYPALAGNHAVNQLLPNNLIHSLMEGGFGAATHANPRPYGMPPFMLQLSDADMAALLSFIRSAWGNQGATVSEFDINKFRRTQLP